MYLEDGDIRAPKILCDLAMFQPERYLAPILNSILSYLEKDVSLVSIYTPKMAILFLQEFVISEQINTP